MNCLWSSISSRVLSWGCWILPVSRTFARILSCGQKLLYGNECSFVFLNFAHYFLLQLAIVSESKLNAASICISLGIVAINKAGWFQTCLPAVPTFMLSFLFLPLPPLSSHHLAFWLNKNYYLFFGKCYWCELPRKVWDGKYIWFILRKFA